jgi:hypothetical protein
MTLLPKLTVQNRHQIMAFAEWAQNNEVSSTTFGFLMRHTSSWMVWLINEMCDFGRQRIHMWFMQDGGRSHTANVVLDFLHDIFDSYIISNWFPDRFACGQNWPPNSPDLNPCDYFLWGFFKEKILQRKPQVLMELRALIIPACSEITEDMCCQVINNITVHVSEVARCNGGHIEHLIHRG